MSTLDEIVQQLLDARLPPLPDGHPHADGKVHRFGPGKKAWYVLHEVQLRSGEVRYIGAYGKWSGPDNGAVKFQWSGPQISDEERAELARRERELEEREAERRQHDADMAANRAADQWRKASPDGTSNYLERKQITPESVRFLDDGTVLVPALHYDEKRLVGLQKIDAAGVKRFNKGMVKKRAACRLGEVTDADRVILIAEGYATGRSIRMALEESIPLYVAFDAGNLLEVASIVRDLYPDAHLLFCADDDWLLEQRLAAHIADEYGVDSMIELDGQPHRRECHGTWYDFAGERKTDANGVGYIELTVSNDVSSKVRRFENAGIAFAKAAAAKLGNASVVWPRFAERGERKLTDFNDLHVEQGLGAVKDQIAPAILMALQPQDVRVKTEQIAAGADASTPCPAAAGSQDPGDDYNPQNGVHWQFQLARSEKGNLLPTLGNVYLILSHHEDWADVIAYDEFTGQVVKLKPPPFIGGETGEWSDMDDLRATLWIQQKYSFHPRKDVVMDAVLLAADLRKFHEVRAYLDDLAWDGQKRVESWLMKYLHVPDSEYARKVGTKWLISAVARIMRPGCKADNVLILEGSQGLYKSTSLKILAGDKWFTDAPFKLGDKDGYALIRGKWLIELGELDSFNKSDSSSAKLFFGQSVDRYRNFYGKRPADVPRMCVFAGTVNGDNYLKDETGNRRYWPVRVTREVDRDGLQADRDQLWAEALHLFQAGVPWWQTSEERELFEGEQDERYEGDVYEIKISHFVIGRARVTVEEILADCLKLDVAKWTLPEQRRIGKCLKAIGWVRRREKKTNAAGKRDWFYEEADRGNDAPPPSTAPAGDDDVPL